MQELSFDSRRELVPKIRVRVNSLDERPCNMTSEAAITTATSTPDTTTTATATATTSTPTASTPTTTPSTPGTPSTPSTPTASYQDEDDKPVETRLCFRFKKMPSIASMRRLRLCRTLAQFKFNRWRPEDEDASEDSEREEDYGAEDDTRDEEEVEEDVRDEEEDTRHREAEQSVSTPLGSTPY